MCKNDLDEFVMSSMTERAKAQILALVAWFASQTPSAGAAFDYVAFSIDRQMPGENAATRAQLGLGTLLAAFVVVVAAMVVLIVVDKFDESLGSPSSSSLSTAQNDVLTGFGSMASLIEPLLLIAIGVVIIGLIRRVQ